MTFDDFINNFNNSLYEIGDCVATKFGVGEIKKIDFDNEKKSIMYTITKYNEKKEVIVSEGEITFKWFWI